MEQSEVKVEVNATISSSQVSPQDIKITLRPGRLISDGSHFHDWVSHFLESELKHKLFFCTYI